MAIYVRNKEGDLSPLNIPAIKGKDGINGVDGVAPNIEVGEITTIETGQEVTATIEGSKENPIIKFSIPKGIDGENGEEGNVTIDDNNISEESVWSPDKITGEIKKSNDKVKEIKSKNADQDNKLKEVERKNELQDFYINGLFNENSHNRMVIEEEGNEIKLEGSKKGFVEVDKIVGNTLVNRVNEPMKELTLNGDIDEKGFSITTNESVENGLVDVVCEGNTLVNCILKNSNYRFVANGDWVITANGINDCLLKPNNVYTLIIYIKENTLNKNGLFELGNTTGSASAFKERITLPNTTTGIYKTTLTTKEDIRECTLSFRNQLAPSCTSGVLEYDSVLLEGDYMDKPIPTEYFKMKSVGEHADGNHKIEILSNNKNLSPINTITPQAFNSGDVPNKYKIADIILKPNTTYTIANRYGDIANRVRLKIYDPVNTCICEAWGTDKKRFNTNNSTSYKIISYDFGNNIPIEDIQIEEANEATSFIPHASNKKEISLKEPLRGLPNKVKDRIIKIDGKWFVERNILTTIIGADEKWNNELVWNNSESKKYMTFTINRSNFREKFNREIINSNSSYSAVSNNIPCNGGSVYKHDKLIFAINGHVNLDFQVSIPKSDLKSLDIDGVNKYFTDNPLTLLVQTSQPIYEPLETAPELVCYDEVTHISNNSMIPCNMVVKNTGFSCMSLLKGGSYTTAHNGDKGVTAKVDIADNMVRLHGKGKKVSDVTVVDGNISKLNYTFKGMKSSFEDKLVTQEMVDKGLEKVENLGKYKVNVKVTGKNLFDSSLLKPVNGVTYGYYKFNPGGKQMILSVTDKDNSINVGGLNLGFTDAGGHVNSLVNWLIQNGHSNVRTLSLNLKYISFHPNTQDTIDKLFARYNFQLEEGIIASQYEPYKEYKTSVYLNSPLLKGDEIVWKEDGLYHYHKMWRMNLKEATTSSTKWNYEDFLTTSFWSNTLKCDKDKSYITITRNTICDKTIDISQANAINITFKEGELSSNDDAGVKAWVEVNNPTVIYDLAEPYYEKISDTNILLDVPNNATLQLDSMLPCQNVKLNYTGKIPNLSVMKNNISIIEERNINTIANNFDMDFRLIELEQALKESKLNLTNTRKSNNISSNRFQQAKILILANRYNKEKMTYQLSKYLERGYLNQEEFDELINLMK